MAARQRCIDAIVELIKGLHGFFGAHTLAPIDQDQCQSDQTQSRDETHKSHRALLPIGKRLLNGLIHDQSSKGRSQIALAEKNLNTIGEDKALTARSLRIGVCETCFRACGFGKKLCSLWFKCICAWYRDDNFPVRIADQNMPALLSDLARQCHAGCFCR